MRITFRIESGKLVKADPLTGLAAAEWSPAATRVVEVTPVEDVIIVREDPAGFPDDKSNVYALDSDFKFLWSAQQPWPGDAYVSLSAEMGRIYGVTRAGYVCTLSRATGAILEKELHRETSPNLTDDLRKSVAAWKGFFDVAGGSILYCISALLILYGIVKILGPILATSLVLKECLPCVGVLNLYEWTLLGVLALIVVWHHVTDDAISLVVLIVLFWVANGIALDTVSPSGPRVIFILGVTCFVLALVKLAILKRYILAEFSLPSLAAVGLILLGNFVSGPRLGLLRMGHATDKTYYLRDPWLLAWLLVLVGGIVICADAARRPARASSEKSDRPFLHTPVMPQLFLLILLAGAAVHQYALAYLFNFDYHFGDFIPLIAVASLFAVEVLRQTGRSWKEWEASLACVPLAAMLCAILSRTVTTPAAWTVELVWYPPVVLGLTGAGIVALAVLHRRPWLWYIAAAYGVGVTLTAGFDPERPYEVNWQVSGAAVVLASLGLGVWYRSARLCLAAVLLAAIGLGTTKPFAHWASMLHVDAVTGVLGVAGLATLLVYVIFPRQLARAIAFFAAVALMIFLFHFVPRPLGPHDLPMTVGVVGLSVALGLRTRDVLPIAVIGLPAVWRMGMFARAMSAWGYVVLSFLVLAAGTYVSIRKGRARKLAALRQAPSA